MKNIKGILAAVTAAATIAAVPAAGLAANAVSAADVKVYVDGVQVQFDTAPLIKNDRTLVPVRAIFEALGMGVSWDEDAKKIVAIGDDKVVYMEIDQYYMSCGSSADNVEVHMMDVTPEIIDDRTYVPVRYAAEAVDCTVDWNNASRTITITSAPEVEEHFDYEVKGSVEMYSGTGIIDFGKLNNSAVVQNVTEIEGKYGYQYADITGEDVVNYMYAIKDKGFALTKSTEFLGIMQLTYEKDGEWVLISYTKSESSLIVYVAAQ